ncbi:MAG TPA: NUDIX hydrolase [Prevotella sp.]
MAIEKWKTLASDYLIKRPWLTARRDKVELPNGKVYDEYYVLEYPDWVNVIALDREGNMILERQWRHAAGIVSTEICAGVIEKGETPLQAAQRELLEETGYAGGNWAHFMTIMPNPSTMTNTCHCFIATNVERISNQHLDETEDIEVLFVPRSEVYTMLQEGQFHQAMMAAPLWKFFADTNQPSQK